MKNGQYIAGIFEAKNQGQLLADMSKAGYMINCIVEMTRKEKEDFEESMSHAASAPKRPTIIK
jgi:hypothetical protein